MPKKNNKLRRRMAFLSALLIFTLILTMVVNGVFAAELFLPKVRNNASVRTLSDDADKEQEALAAEQAEQEADAKERKGDSLSLIPLPSAKRAVEDAISGRGDLLSGLNRISGYGSIDYEEEYQIIGEKSYDGGVLYRLQQVYEGLPVLGYMVNVNVDSDGNLQYVDGRHAELLGLNTDTQLSSSEAGSQAEKYLKRTYGETWENSYLQAGQLSIYMQDESTPCVGYPVLQYNGRDDYIMRVLFVDANDGNILYDAEEVDTLRAEVNLGGQQVNQTFFAEQLSADEYQLSDTDTHFAVYDGQSVTYATSGDVAAVYQDDPIISWETGEESSVNASAVDALANLERIYTFYADVFSRSGLTNADDPDEVPVVVDVRGMNGSSYENNAAMCGGNQFIVIGTASQGDTMSAYLDVMGHEFTHGVFNTETGSIGQNRSQQLRAMNEGFADVFGEFAEDYLDDQLLNGTCNWVLGTNRSAITAPAGQLTRTQDFTNQTEQHSGIYLISHTVYLMSNGIDGSESKKIGNDQLAYFFYDLLPKLSPTDNFNDLRRKIEAQAYHPDVNGSHYTLTDAQIECILDALDQLGYVHSYDYAVTPGAELTIYDINKLEYSDVRITLTRMDGVEIVSGAAAPDGVFTLPASAVPGIYQLLIEDNASDGTAEFKLIINDNAAGQQIDFYQEKEDLFTNFGSIEGQVVLVLDTSGSMDGQPAGALKKAAAAFVRTLREQAPRVRIDIVTYDYSANILAENERDAYVLQERIRGISTGGATNLYDGLSTGRGLLTGAANAAMVVMSDGLPNEGTNESGDYAAAAITLAESIRNEGIDIYSFGFFHALSGQDLTDGQNLIRQLAQSGYSYNVSSGESQGIISIFENIAYQITHKGNTTHIEVHCPVDVTVRYGGEELSSKEGGNLMTSWGLMTFEGEEDDEKILNLKTGPDYEVILEGTGTGTMTYTISYADENGSYSDVRSFVNIPIRRGTFIVTSAARNSVSEMEVDTDGDGTPDTRYTAGAGQMASAKISGAALRPWLIVLGAFALFFAAYGAWILWDRYSRKRMLRAMAGVNSAVYRRTVPGAGFCTACGAALISGNRFCTNCGTPVYEVPLRTVQTVEAMPDLPEPKRSGKGGRIIKLALVGVLVAELVCALLLYGSAPTRVFKKLKSHEYVSAAYTYEMNVKDSSWKTGYLSMLTNNYVNRADAANRDGDLNEASLQELLETVADMDMGKASKTANDFLIVHGMRQL